MLRFSRLRLTGFKSFVDPTELHIEPGLTGVVGPNGCGKSNLVEALRWVMGESSARQMRGGGMDDVIFGGSAERPARNIAEVVLNLDNRERTAPARFNDMEELDVSRRIERQKGSTYRINGKETRAKDVQLLFADQATGARSTAIVSQGRIGAVINAKPAERRSLLEEAAGITGLHSRRHEAELRLRGAETNLERLEDILGALDAQMQGLKKQARQANRYRNLSEHIRKAEATLFHLRWLAAGDETDRHRDRLAAAAARVGELSRLAARASTNQGETAAGLPELRRTEADAAAELHRLSVARDGLDAEQRRITEARAEAARRIAQIDADLEREQSLAKDANDALRALNGERQDIEKAQHDEEHDGRVAAGRLAEANRAVDGLDAELTGLTERLAGDEAGRSGLQRTAAELTGRIERLNGRAAETGEQRARLGEEAIESGQIEAAKKALESRLARRDAARRDAAAAERRRGEAAEAVSAAVAGHHARQSTLTRLQAEEQALADVLRAGDGGQWPALIDEISVDAGFEAALGAALGEDLSASGDQSAPVRWRALEPFPQPAALPAGTEPLSGFVSGPPALARRLGQIGVVEDGGEGGRLADLLQQGQRLVSRDGEMWRWDGYCVSAGARTAAAARLEQRNRLNTVRAGQAEAEAEAAATETAAEAARGLAEQAQAAERQARAGADEADGECNRARETLTGIKEKAARHSSRLAALVEMSASIEADLREAESAAAEIRQALADLPDAAAARDAISALRADLAERRTIQLERQSGFDSLTRAAGERRRRLADIERELASWRGRSEGAGQHIEQLGRRRHDESDQLQRLASLPGELIEKRDALHASISEGEEKRRQSAAKLAAAESRLAEADRNLRDAETQLAQAREDRVRAEGLVEQSAQAMAAIAERVLDKLDAEPGELFEIAGLKKDGELPDMAAGERKVDRLIRERDTMGAVNLRAEHESRELSEQIATLRTERDDLIEAIAKLRQGIAELNREGRQRLLQSFQQVDRHFQELFVRLFGGGKAHLALTESDDPLEAGLEIMASPPGKRLQVLSLLSGGEQALTALALLFGVFLTNPAPICVLDEVDAPLDDANVDRFCAMLGEMAAPGTTRFLVITHHRLTMARMDRLFGVTMSERGVSQLVSVNLNDADGQRDSA